MRFSESPGGSSSYWAVALRFFTLNLFLTPPLGVWEAKGKPAGGSLSGPLDSQQQEGDTLKPEGQKWSWIRAASLNHWCVLRYQLRFHIEVYGSSVMETLFERDENEPDCIVIIRLKSIIL